MIEPLLISIGWLAIAPLPDERLAGIACRSVHLAYEATGRDYEAIYNELTPDRSAPGTYFYALGFNRGYFGLQELADGKKLVIFSVWDPGQQDDPAAVDESDRVRLVHKNDATRIGRFGGEGTGGQSFLDHDWQIGQTYGFLVRARVNGQRTEFAAYFRATEAVEWIHVVTFSTLAEGERLGGFYAFLEDFRRNRVSSTQPREACFGNAWVEDRRGNWNPVTAARFTADTNPVTNIDAGARDGRFFLATGGETKNTHTRLGNRIALVPPVDQQPPSNLP